MSGVRDVCSTCYWGECLEKVDVCEGQCLCRCVPRRPVSDSTNTLVRKALARELRAHVYAQGSGMAPLERAGIMSAAEMIDRGEI